jgi:hypothetical protein
VRFYRVGCPRCQAGSFLRQSLERAPSALPGTAHHFAGADLRRARLVINVPATVAAPEVKDRAGFLNTNAFG